MEKRKHIDAFLGCKNIAVAGASRNSRKFGTLAAKELMGKGYAVYPVNPHAEQLLGTRCYAAFRDLPDDVNAALIVVPRNRTEQAVREALEAGIEHIWVQQGADPGAAAAECRNAGVTLVANECILMYAEPVGFVHRIHRFVWKLIGRYAA